MRIDKLLTLSAAEYPSDMMTVIIGFVVVFSVLLLLTLIFWLFGKVAGRNANAAPRRAVAVTPSVPSVSAPVVANNNNDVPDEVVAVIAAAVAAMSTDGKQYAVRRIRPAATRGSRSVWASAGVAENTRPF